MTTMENDGEIPLESVLKRHWNEAYTKTVTQQLGWFEASCKETIDLIHKTNLPKDAMILNVGVGSSVLVDELLSDGYSNVIAHDISEKALAVLANRLKEDSNKVTYLLDDLSKPLKLQHLQEIAIWNDRAVLHFFTEEKDQNTYFETLKKVVKKGGFVIIAVFALHGAKKCCGLSLQRYDAAMLQKKLGKEFELLTSFEHVFINPYNSERPYIYTLFQRKNK